MPQHKSAKKRLKTSLKNQASNRANRSALRKKLKELAELAAKKRDKASHELQSLVDRAVKQGIIHKNKAARLKSRYRKHK